MTIPFDETRFPVVVGLGARGGPRWNTNVVAVSSGAEQRNQLWVYPLHQWNVAAGIRSLADFAQVRGFFLARRGRQRGFRFKDFADYSSAALPGLAVTAFDQAIGTGPGPHQLLKTYADDVAPLTRRITKPVAGSVRIGVDGVAQTSPGWTFPWSVDVATGIVTFTGVGPALPGIAAAITAGFEFDVPVRFNADQLDAEHIEPEILTASSIDLIEIRI
jgi:uncharacterized protein (TIGR02217 family)